MHARPAARQKSIDCSTQAGPQRHRSLHRHQRSRIAKWLSVAHKLRPLPHPTCFSCLHQRHRCCSPPLHAPPPPFGGKQGHACCSESAAQHPRTAAAAARSHCHPRHSLPPHASRQSWETPRQGQLSLMRVAAPEHPAAIHPERWQGPQRHLSPWRPPEVPRRCSEVCAEALRVRRTGWR
jgi:hypothetical protein